MSRYEPDPRDPLSDILARDRRYRREAYDFVMQGLEYAQRKAFGIQSGDEPDDEEAEEEHHVTGQQLCEAIRDYALGLYGMTAKCVLQHWGIRTTRDIGEIVFNMIEAEQMRKTDRDRIEDFDDVYDFEEAFRPGFRLTMPKPSEGHWA
jgi:uncharacterized repeat protein (TIGR04138 family)